MKKRLSLAIAVVAATIGFQAAQAQPTATSFRGFRAEGQVGLDRFQAQGDHHDKLGYGGAAGFDGIIGDRFVLGAEGSFWRANKWNEICAPGGSGGSVCLKSFQEWGAAVRAGVLVTPQMLVYAKGGYVNNEQRKRFDAPVGQSSFYDHYRTDGYQVGGGIEYSLTDMFYVNGEYKYSNYHDHTARQRALIGFGVRLKP